MLSIGKLAVGQADYYLEQAHGAVTRAGSVRSGVEDYYLRGPEAPGTWIGAGTRPLGLQGKVDADRLDRVLAGEHPVSGEPLGRVVRQRVPGFDLTFSAPKSVSVLFGVGDDELRGVIRDAHDHAVAEALGYFEREAVATRRGAGGVNVIRGRGSIGAVFRHRTSRAGDPQLHTHVLVANLVLGADGRWGTLDGRRIYAHAKTAGYLYEARLRSLLTRELGVAWGPVRNGIADVDRVPAPVLRAFSRRRAEIEAELERRGATSAGAAQVAALATRRAKDYRVTPEQLVPEWRRRAAELALDADAIRSLLGRERVTRLTAEHAELIADRLAGASGLTERRSSFTPRDVVQAYCELVAASAGLSVGEIEKLASEFLRSPRAVVLATGESRSGDPAAVEPERQYSTPELLALEREIIDHAISEREHRVSPRAAAAVERAIRRRPTMADEQAAMVRRLLLDESAVAVVVGQAGTGKTFALDAAREAWDASGRRVIGVALARRAALELQRSAGIPSTSMTALLEELRRRPSAIRRGSVVVVDEAGMVPTRELAEIVRHVREADAKLVLVGDHRQLPELGAGGAFRGLLTRVPVIELRENRRQVAGWERDALQLVRSGAAVEAVDRYAVRERIVVGDDAAEVRRRLVADWWAAGDPDSALMLAHRRADVADLNGRAHALMRAAGALGGDELDGFATGDRVVLRRNDRDRRVVNGDRGNVVEVDMAARELTVQLGARRVTLGPDYLGRLDRHGRAPLQHGYAITGHLAQGLTCRRTFVLATDQLSREWGYVALSRGTDSNRLYVIEGDPSDRLEYAPGSPQPADARAALVAGLGRSDAQQLAVDAVPAAELVQAAAALADAQQARDAAEAASRRLERREPPWYRRRARREHAAALDAARNTLRHATSTLELCRASHRQLLAQPERDESIVHRLRAGRSRSFGLER